MRYSSALHEALASVRRVGLKSTAALAVARVYDTAFDMRWKVDTAKRAELDELNINEESVGRGQMYQPTGVLQFQHVLEHVAFPKPGVLVDYGCGKGRTLLLAARSAFQRVVGIEFSAELCDVARANVIAFEKAGQLRAPVDVVCVDAARYAYRGDENIFYFFYPFDADLMERVMDGIDASLAASPRDAVLVYYYPIHREVLDRRPSFKLEQHFPLYGYDCLVYRHLREAS